MQDIPIDKKADHQRKRRRGKKRKRRKERGEGERKEGEEERSYNLVKQQLPMVSFVNNTEQLLE